MRSSSYLDLAIFACVVLWFEKFEEYIYDENSGFNLTDPPKESHRFMLRLLNDVETGAFHFDWLLAATAFLFWMRLISMLQLTRVFGPLIRTIMAMLQDLMVFLVLFFLQLVAFACVGILAFGMLEEYETLWDAFILHFATSMGGFNFNMYTPMGDEKKYYGIVFHKMVLLCTLLLMVNLVIAIMSDTYARLSEVQLGLYSVGIIEVFPSYRYDKFYGGLIVMTPPLNVLAYFLWPLYHNIKDKKLLAKFNKKVGIIFYFPFACVFTLVFGISSLIMAPFAWVKVILLKFSLRKRSQNRKYYI